MPEDAVSKAQEAVETAKRGKEALDDTRGELGEMKEKLSIAEAVAGELEDFKRDFKEIDTKEKMKRLGGIAAIAILGLFMSKEDLAKFRRDRKDIRVIEEEAFEEEEEIEEGVEPKRQVVVRIPLTEEEKEEATEVDEELRVAEGDEYFGEAGRKEWLVNMTNGAKKYFDGKGRLRKKYQKMLESGKITPEEIPDKYLFTGRGIFRDMPSTFEAFKARLLEKWFPHAKDKDRALELCTNILRSCALGRFQVLPKFHFDKLGWKTRGEEGLRDMYNYLRSPRPQWELYEKGLHRRIQKYSSSKYAGHELPVLCAIDYYSGPGGVSRYMRDVNDPVLRKRAYKNHGSIISYRDAVMRRYKHWRSKGFNQYEAIAISIEKTESNGSYARRMFEARKKGGFIAPEKSTGPEIARAGNRVLSYAVSDEAKGYLGSIDPEEPLVVVAEYAKHNKEIEVKETTAKALKLAKQLATRDGYDISVFSGYRSAETQAALKKGHEASNQWVAPPGGSWHQSGGTVDVILHRLGVQEQLTPTRGKEIKGDKYEKLLEKYMNAAGFVRYEAEPWHFEIGSKGWAKIMSQQGILEEDTKIAQVTYKKDQLGEETHHRHGKTFA